MQVEDGETATLLLYQDHPPGILLRNGRGNHRRSLGFFGLFEARPILRIFASLDNY
jgi:hypothetical protein